MKSQGKAGSERNELGTRRKHVSRNSGGMQRSRCDVHVLRKPMATCGVEGLREATTGQLVTMLPRVWAVGDGGKPKQRTSSSREGLDEAADWEVAFYRKYTEALLRRYQRLRLQVGRASSPLDW